MEGQRLDYDISTGYGCEFVVIHDMTLGKLWMGKINTSGEGNGGTRGKSLEIA